MDQRAARSLGAILAAVLALAPATAAADAFVRVLVQRANVHTGPGGEFRTMAVAERGQVLSVKERGTKGYWFRVELEDGTTGWIYGEEVVPFEVVDEEEEGFFSRMWGGIRKAIFGPVPVQFSDVELS